MDFNVFEFVQSLVPLLPTLVIAYCLIKILSSGLNLVSKVISVLLVVGTAYLLWTYIAPYFGVHLPLISLPAIPESFNW